MRLFSLFKKKDTKKFLLKNAGYLIFKFPYDYFSNCRLYLKKFEMDFILKVMKPNNVLKNLDIECHRRDL